MPLSGNILSGFLHSGFQCLLLCQQAGRALIQCLRLFLQLLPGFFPGILQRLTPALFSLRILFPQYICRLTIVTVQGFCLHVVIPDKGILSGGMRLFCLPQCLLISAYLALYPAGL
ncbi:Uncharacterised protein [Klebsiella pneumoniae]|nr:Uncharacterised protein [Klebsiella pneumoniae]